jgi:hypothetical protein
MFELGTVGDVVIDEMDKGLWDIDVFPLCDRDSRQENSLFEYISPVLQATGFLGETSAPLSLYSPNLQTKHHHSPDCRLKVTIWH